MMEKTYKSDEIYHGKIINLLKDEVILDDGQHSYREVVEHRGGACIAIEDLDGKFIMVKQYRYAQKCEVLEFCAGKLEPEEKPDVTVVREAIEETGYDVELVHDFGYMMPTPGYVSERIYLYHGRVKAYLGQTFDEDEKIELYHYSLDEIEMMIKKGEIVDAKTICLVYHLRNIEQ